MLTDLLLVIVAVTRVVDHRKEQQPDQTVPRSTPTVHECVRINVSPVRSVTQAGMPIAQPPLAVPAEENPFTIRDLSGGIPVVGRPVKIL